MSDERPDGQSRLRQRLAHRRSAEEALPLPEQTHHAGGLLKRLHQTPTVHHHRPGAGGLKHRLDSRIHELRETADLLVVLAAGPRFHQIGNFYHVVSNGRTSQAALNHLHEPNPDNPAFILTSVPRADLTEPLPGDANVDLVAPDLARLYRFRRVTTMTYHGAETTVPMLGLMVFPWFEHTLRTGPGVAPRLWALLQERALFEGCLGVGIADLVVATGGSVFQVCYWVHHHAERSPTGALFAEDQLDCTWSADPAEVVRVLNNSVEIGLKYVEASGYVRGD